MPCHFYCSPARSDNATGSRDPAPTRRMGRPEGSWGSSGWFCGPRRLVLRATMLGCASYWSNAFILGGSTASRDPTLAEISTEERSTPPHSSMTSDVMAQWCVTWIVATAWTSLALCLFFYRLNWSEHALRPLRRSWRLPVCVCSVLGLHLLFIFNILLWWVGDCWRGLECDET